MHICNATDIIVLVKVEGSIIATENDYYEISVVIPENEFFSTSCAVLVENIKEGIAKKYNPSMYRVAAIMVTPFDDNYTAWDMMEYVQEEDEEEWFDVDDDFSSNCHCDTYGICGGYSCSNYVVCHNA